MAPKIVKIFIAEDSPTTKASLKAILQKASDMEIIGEATAGDEAVSKVQSLKPDLVLMDIGLPGISGLEATKRLKSENPELKVIMVTSNDTDATIFEAFSCGADGYFMKSNTEQLLQAVRSVSSGAAWLHPAIAGRVLRACVTGADKLEAAKSGLSHHEVAAAKRHYKNEVLGRLAEIADRLAELEQFEDADAVMDGACALCADQNLDKRDWADLVTKQADWLYEQEKFSKAETLYQKALELRHQVLGYEHQDVAASLENLANLYDTRSSYAEAEHYYFWSLKIREKLGPNDPITSETCSKLAWVYRAQGKSDLADEMDMRSGKKKQS